MSVVSRREREKEQRREEILDAALRVFLAKGYEATTMGEVATESELSKGTLYLYFESKLALFAALSNRVLSKLGQSFQVLLSKNISGIDCVREMLKVWVQVGMTYLEQFRLAMQYISSTDSPSEDSETVAAHRSSIAGIISMLAQAVQSGIDDNSIRRRENSHTTACQLWSSMMGGLMYVSKNTRCSGHGCQIGIPAEEYMESFISLLVSGLSVDNSEGGVSK